MNLEKCVLTQLEEQFDLLFFFLLTSSYFSAWMAARSTSCMSVSELRKHFQLEDEASGIGGSTDGKGEASGKQKLGHTAVAIAESVGISEAQSPRQRVSRHALNSYFSEQSPIHKTILEQVNWAEKDRGVSADDEVVDSVFHVSDLERIPYNEQDWGQTVVRQSSFS